MSRVLSSESVNQKARKVQYAVRGKIVLRANDLQEEGHRIIFCNIGNPQALEQRPVTFFREVLSLTSSPHLLDDPKKKALVEQLYAVDVIERAKKYIAATGNSTGAYTHSKGIKYIRQEIADFLEARDNFPADVEDIFLTDGASPAVQRALNIIIADENTGIMIPIPQYPLYSATIDLLGGVKVPYYLDESQGWGMSVDELEKQYKKSTDMGINVKAICIINPGNPTAQVLPEESIRDIIHFCKEKKLVILADEVYQINVYNAEKSFVSFRKVLHDMGEEYSNVELFSFHSVSKGVIGECGRRGGYAHVMNIDEDVKEVMYKVASVNLCSNVEGQIMMGMMVNPPKPGDPSFESYSKEVKEQYESLKRRAQKLSEGLNELEGMSCNIVEGAMYAFPQIVLPPKVGEVAAKLNLTADAYYCWCLLEEEHVCVVPGSGFGQKEGTMHFRTTILPPEKDMDSVIERVRRFHAAFLKKHAE